MREFVVTVNGVSYDVQVEEKAAGTPRRIIAAPPPAQVPAAPSAPAPTVPVSVNAPAGATVVKTPMPGTIVKVNVSVGDTVKFGTVLAVLEAMKMENDIVSPVDGRVTAVHALKGSAAVSGAALFVIE